MKQENDKNFADKHTGKTPNARIEAEITTKIINGELPCVLAFDIATRLNIKPAEVGVTCDLMNLKISKCQLGLFGYHLEHKVASGKKEPVALLKDALMAAQFNHRITCETAWNIAAELKVGKIAVGNGCEALGIKIKACQLGVF
ncbi:MAG: hypothetical protein RBT11_01925 [Desulfobacterales bacterium]|jgi:hypothetical protein|nr:hypothetical protein [Desulfobacterales bacterium]